MDEKKAKKAGGKKEVKFEEGAPASTELVFGATSGNDMVNFGGEDENFGEAKRETNVIRKLLKACSREVPSTLPEIFTCYEPLNLDLHYQQRTARKCLTIVQGLPDDLDDKKLLRAFKKMYHCNGTVVEDEEKGLIIQLQGDFRRDLA